MAAIQLTGSVGLGGKNNPQDVKTIQVTLNKLLALIPPTRKLAVDSRLGSRPENSKTVEAIKLFQKKVVGMIRPDGIIDPNGKSHRKINEKLSALTVAAVAPISATLKKKLFEYEGNVPHMYLDTKGFVTVGVGHLLKDVEVAKKMPFVVRDTGVSATVKQIEDEFKLIKKRPFGNKEPAFKFKAFTSLIITDSTINAEVVSHISNFENELKRIYGAAEFSAFPNNVKLALFDMIFNLGMTKLNNLFFNFNKHIKSGDYKKAALESSRTGISGSRNAYVANLLSTAI